MFLIHQTVWLRQWYGRLSRNRNIKFDHIWYHRMSDRQNTVGTMHIWFQNLFQKHIFELPCFKPICLHFLSIHIDIIQASVCQTAWNICWFLSTALLRILIVLNISQNAHGSGRFIIWKHFSRESLLWNTESHLAPTWLGWRANQVKSTVWLLPKFYLCWWMVAIQNYTLPVILFTQYFVQSNYINDWKGTKCKKRWMLSRALTCVVY